MSTGRIDVHAHLIPGVDDGCQTLGESIECARQFLAAGYTHAFCTPHIWPSFPRNVAVNILRWTADLQTEYDRASVPLRLLPGGEINFQTAWPAMQSLSRMDIVSYGLLGKHVLFDFWADSAPDYLLPAVAHLRSLGLVPILAHPERIRVIQENAALLEKLMDMGLRLQCNTWCLMDRPGMPTRDVSERLLRADKYFLLGTDCHNPSGLPVRFAGVSRAIEMVGEEKVRELTITNPRTLLPPEMRLE
jgi:protein-tyrosine phosphatase